MDKAYKLAEEIVNGRRLTKADDISVLKEAPDEELYRGADLIRDKLCGDHIDLCAIINGRSGRCSEDCKFCAQSGHHDTGIDEYGFLDKETLVKDCGYHAERGIDRYSIVTAGRTLKGKDLDAACDAYKEMHDKYGDRIELCASHGLLDEEAFKRLKDSGVSMYHENIETSRRFFPHICTTHEFDDKIKGIRAAHAAGLSVCSGGIFGMGETEDDRIDMAFTLAEEHVESIPLNALIPIKGTALELLKPPSARMIMRSAAYFRYINPTAFIRLAGGRYLMEDSGRQAFHAGVNATITGDMLTTSGNNISEDREMLTGMGFDIKPSEIEAQA
ncbi:MAG: biotin synthase BioB [Anaerovoracaceae bacterium]|nr:biotin synthase BioB [Bacillota bacterium]MDY2669984.1 biotin synthase BioB [Anaerovoracaceae bacterium]